MLTFLRELLSSAYMKKLNSLHAKLPAGELPTIYKFGQKLFSRYGQKHWAHLEDFLTDFQAEYPTAIQFRSLPQGLLGAFLPIGEDGKIGTILLNEKNGEALNLATLGHENAHMLVHLWRCEQEERSNYSAQPYYARQENLEQSLEDSEEYLADALHCLGAYPRASFVKTFCDEAGAIKPYYKRVPLVLYLRSVFYAWKYYRDVCLGFWKSSHKIFYIGLGIHLVRLRVFIYEQEGL